MTYDRDMIITRCASPTCSRMIETPRLHRDSLEFQVFMEDNDWMLVDSEAEEAEWFCPRCVW